MPPWDDLKQLAGGLAMYFGLLSALTSIIDWFIGDKQRKFIKYCLEEVWIFLAKQSAGRFLKLLMIKPLQRIIGATGLLLVLWGEYGRFNASIADGLTIRFDWLLVVKVTAFTFACFFVIFYFIPKLLDFFTKTPPPRLLSMYLMRSATKEHSGGGLLAWLFRGYTSTRAPIWFFLKLWLSYELIGVVYMFSKYYAVEFGVIEFNEHNVAMLVKTGWLVNIMYAGLIPLEILAMQLRAIFFISLLWFAIVICLMLVMRLMQLIVFRIVTYDRGPVLAVSALVTACGALLKFFESK